MISQKGPKQVEVAQVVQQRSQNNLEVGKSVQVGLLPLFIRCLSFGLSWDLQWSLTCKILLIAYASTSI